MKDAKEIPMSCGRSILVDEVDFVYLSQFHWSLSRTRDRCYAHRRRLKGELYTSKTVKIHRLILGLVGIEYKHIHIDHINGNGLDNRRKNLRICTPTQNQANARCRNKKGIKGITKDRNKWRARIRKNNILIDLGHYPTIELAGEAYDCAAKELFGEFARLNSPSRM